MQPIFDQTDEEALACAAQLIIEVRDKHIDAIETAIMQVLAQAIANIDRATAMLTKVGTEVGAVAKAGDLIKFSATGKVTRVAPGGQLAVNTHNGERMFVSPDQVDIVDNPAHDPIGTVRRNFDGHILVKTAHAGEYPWAYVNVGRPTQRNDSPHVMGDILGMCPGMEEEDD